MADEGKIPVLMMNHTQLKEGKNRKDLESFWDVCANEVKATGKTTISYEMYHNSAAGECVCCEEFDGSAGMAKNMEVGMEAMQKNPTEARMAIYPAFLTPTEPMRLCGILDEGMVAQLKGFDPSMGFYSDKLAGSFRTDDYYTAKKETIRYDMILSFKDGKALTDELKENLSSLADGAKGVDGCMLFEMYHGEDSSKKRIILQATCKNSAAFEAHWRVTGQLVKALNADVALPCVLKLCGPASDEALAGVKDTWADLEARRYDLLPLRIKCGNFLPNGEA